MPVRLDKWLWAARFFKTRTLAAESIDTGRVEVNGERAKRSRAITVGDTLRIRKPPFEQVIEVFTANNERLRDLLFAVIPKIGGQPDDVCAKALEGARI